MTVGRVNASYNDSLCTLEEKFAWNDDNCFFKMQKPVK